MSSPSFWLARIVRADVGRHDDQRVLEVDGAALAVGEAAVVEHLQQHVEHVRVRLLDLVEQDDLIGAPAHGLGERAALLVADVARRRADQAGDGVLLHVLAHVDAHHGGLVVEQERGERLGQLGLADAGRPQEDERADRPVRVLQAGARTPDRRGDGLDRLALADHALGQRLFHAQQLVALALQHPLDRDAGPARDDLGDVVGRDGLLDHRALGLLAFERLELLLERRDDAVGQLAGAPEIAAALRLRQLGAALIELHLQLLGVAQLALLAFPAPGQRLALLLQLGDRLVEARQPVLGGRIALLAQRLALDPHLHEVAIDGVELLGLGIDLHLQARGRLVDQVDGLVGQEAVGDVAVGQRRRGHQRASR